MVLHRELKALGYDRGYSILKSYVSPRRRRRQPDATTRFETAPGEQAQVDWGSLAYRDQDGRKHRICQHNLSEKPWIPAFAGMTVELDYHQPRLVPGPVALVQPRQQVFPGL